MLPNEYEAEERRRWSLDKALELHKGESRNAAEVLADARAIEAYLRGDEPAK